MIKTAIKAITICSLLILFTSTISSAQCRIESYFSPYDNIESLIVKRLSEAKESINCSLYGITNRKITAALIDKASNGVDVTLCLDKTQSAGKNSTHRELEDASVEIVIKKTGVLEHNKFCVMATQLLNADADLVTIQDLLGHAKITTTQRYCKVSNLKVQRDYYKAIEVETLQ